MGVRYRHVALPLAFSLVNASLSALSLGLLVPIARGLARQDFSSALRVPLLGGLLTRALGGSSDRRVLFALLIAVFAAATVNHVIRLFATIYRDRSSGMFADRIN